MGLWLLFAVWLVYASSVLAQDAPKVHLRFFNDSAKAVDFYVDGQFRCSVQANPEENEAYCDTEAGVGKRTVSIKEAGLPHQSCDVYVSADGAYVNLSRGKRLHCFSYGRARNKQCPELLRIG
jgi:hypothetical protein